jgi:hypothetical protein
MPERADACGKVAGGCFPARIVLIDDLFGRFVAAVPHERHTFHHIGSWNLGVRHQEAGGRWF